MTTKEHLEAIVESLPDSRLNELLDFARFLRWQDDREQWQEFGRNQLARAYGSDEPEYTPHDIKAAVNS
jgi:hypothetical protein